MRLDPDKLPEAALAFLTERHLATLATIRPDGSPHVVAVGFTYDPDTRTAWVITSGDSVKARNARRDRAVAALCSVDGARWISLTGPVRMETAPEVVRDAERRYARRYRTPRPNPKRVALIVDVERISASARLSGRPEALAPG